MSFLTGSYKPMRSPPNMHCRCRPARGGGAAAAAAARNRQRPARRRRGASRRVASATRAPAREQARGAARGPTGGAPGSSPFHSAATPSSRATVLTVPSSPLRGAGRGARASARARGAWRAPARAIARSHCAAEGAAPRARLYLGASPAFSALPCVCNRTLAVSSGMVVASAMHAATAEHANDGRRGRVGPLAGGLMVRAGARRRAPPVQYHARRRQPGREGGAATLRARRGRLPPVKGTTAWAGRQDDGRRGGAAGLRPLTASARTRSRALAAGSSSMAGAPDTELDSLLDGATRSPQRHATRARRLRTRACADALNGFTPAASSAAGEPLRCACDGLRCRVRRQTCRRLQLGFGGALTRRLRLPRTASDAARQRRRASPAVCVQPAGRPAAQERQEGQGGRIGGIGGWHLCSARRADGRCRARAHGRPRAPDAAAGSRCGGAAQRFSGATHCAGAQHFRAIPAARLRAGARLGGDEAGEEDIQATIAALEAQTRFTTGSSADTLQGVDDVAAGPSGGLPPGMDEAAYQAMLGQARAAHAAVLSRPASCAALRVGACPRAYLTRPPGTPAPLRRSWSSWARTRAWLRCWRA
jgi:hypothetical protein